MIELRGMSWDHPRGHDSVVATVPHYQALNPEVSISWRTRSLQDFADYPVEKLAEMFDLILIDHPFTGFMAASGYFLPVDEHVDADCLADQAANSVGPSHRSYQANGHQWAFATDAAAHVASYRPDLMESIDAAIPDSWDAVVALAERRTGKDAQVAIPLIPVDTLMSFCSICASFGEEPFAGEDVVVSRPMGRHALELLARLREAIHPESMTWNPIRCYDRMSTTAEVAYVPIAFGYANYARRGFRPHLVRFTNVPRAADGVARGGILGGVGLTVSSFTKHPEAAFDYATYVASAQVQSGIFFEGGGQPGHRAAWLSPEVNAASSNFFLDTLETLDNAYLRPRYNGFVHVQDTAFLITHDFLKGNRSVDETLDAMDELYRGSRKD
jgi:multiple sugar transport system substrate-binding protein